MSTPGLRPTTVALPTLGCKANRYDSDTLARLLIARGYVIVPAQQAADIYIINTCTVTQGADAKSRKALRRALRMNDDALLVVTGCFASLEPERAAALDGVDAVVPITEQHALPDLLVRLRPPAIIDAGATTGSLTASIARTRATVKVQDGCNLRRAFCAVTLARGPVRSRPLPEVVAELRALVAQGMREIVLTGIRLDAYGLDTPHTRLADLVDATRALQIPRLRLSSLEPIGINDRLVASLAAHPTLCHHFHLCLQSGDDAVLRAMRRGYTAEEFRRLVAHLRTAMPTATFTTDVIVGFPGESDAAFARTRALIEELGFIKLHIFPFSPRPRTEAATLPDQLPDAVKTARAAQLAAVERANFHAYAQSLLGQRVAVLVERTGAHGDGLTPHYLRVRAPFPRGSAGKIVPVILREIAEESVVATLS